MEETLIIRLLGNSPTLRIIDFLLDNRLFDYTKNEILRNLEMGKATFFKYWKELERLGAVKVTRRIGKANLYRLNKKMGLCRKL